MTRAGAALLAAAALLCALAAGAEEVAVPPLTARVTDQTATLSSEQKAALEQKLQAFETTKGSQLVVLMVPTTGNEAIEQYSLRVVEQWKLGRKNVDDGALLIVAKNDRKLRIEVGYGLEGKLNDATSKRIISEIITPYFKQGDFYGGIDAGVDRLIGVINGEPLPEPTRQTTHDHRAGFGQLVPIVFLLVIVVGGVLRALFGRLTAAVVAGGGTALLAWFLIGAVSITLGAAVIAFFITLVGGGMGRRGGWYSGGGFSGGGGFGGGGGGFSGGGGGFGGGGASGNW